MISKFTDYTKFGGVRNSEEQSLRLQDNIDGLVRRAEQSQIEFNLEKCEVMQFGRTNKAREYTMDASDPRKYKGSLVYIVRFSQHQVKVQEVYCELSERYSSVKFLCCPFLT